MRIPLERFRCEDAGIASVEFALISSTLLIFFAGTFDIAYMVGAKRDADRASMLIARAMATCANSSCVSELINTYVPRQANALVRNPTADVDLYMIQRRNGQIKACSGTQQVLSDSDVLASAMNVMKDDDVGTAVVMTTTYTSIMPKGLMKYINSTGATYRYYTVDVLGNLGSVC